MSVAPSTSPLSEAEQKEVLVTLDSIQLADARTPWETAQARLAAIGCDIRRTWQRVRAGRLDFGTAGVVTLEALNNAHNVTKECEMQLVGSGLTPSEAAEAFAADMDVESVLAKLPLTTDTDGNVIMVDELDLYPQVDDDTRLQLQNNKIAQALRVLSSQKEIVEAVRAFPKQRSWPRDLFDPRPRRLPPRDSMTDTERRAEDVIILREVLHLHTLINHDRLPYQPDHDGIKWFADHLFLCVGSWMRTGSSTLQLAFALQINLEIILMLQAQSRRWRQTFWDDLDQWKPQYYLVADYLSGSEKPTWRDRRSTEHLGPAWGGDLLLRSGPISDELKRLDAVEADVRRYGDAFLDRAPTVWSLLLAEARVTHFVLGAALIKEDGGPFWRCGNLYALICHLERPSRPWVDMELLMQTMGVEARLSLVQNLGSFTFAESSLGEAPALRNQSRSGAALTRAVGRMRQGYGDNDAVAHDESLAALEEQLTEDVRASSFPFFPMYIRLVEWMFDTQRAYAGNASGRPVLSPEQFTGPWLRHLPAVTAGTMIRRSKTFPEDLAWPAAALRQLMEQPRGDRFITATRYEEQARIWGYPGATLP